MVQMRIMQIGTVRALEFREDLIDGESYSSKVESERGIGAIEDIVRDVKYIGQKNRDIKLSFLLYSSETQIAENFLQYLKGNVGATIPIIAYVMQNNMFKANNPCCSCVRSDKCCVNYIAALGTITKISEPKQKDYNTAPEVSVSIELTTYWTSIDFFMWQVIYATEKFRQSIITPDINLDYRLPSCKELLRKCKNCQFTFSPLQYDDYSFIYDPLYMARSIEAISGDCYGSCCTGEIGFVETYAPPTFSANIGLKSNFYNAPPKPLIVFDGITGTNDLIFRGSSARSGITKMTFESKVLITETNELLVNNGYTALDTNDKIIVGDFNYSESGTLLRNGIIVKNGVVLTDVQPVFTSDGAFFGYFDPANDSKVVVYGDFNYSHIKLLYRRA